MRQPSELVDINIYTTETGGMRQPSELVDINIYTTETEV